MTPRALGELAALVGGEVIGNGALHVSGVAGLSDAAQGELSFFTNPRYQAALAKTRAAAVLIPRDAEQPKRAGVAWVRVSNPHLAYARIAQVFHPELKQTPGIDPKADVHPNAEVDPTATVMAFATVSGGARVGPRAVLFPGVYLGRNARVGRQSVLHANVVVREDCSVGRRCILHAGVVVGADGFGFAFDAAGPAHVKIPQVGKVVIEDDVEIGANSCIDRATSGETVIGKGSKLDNLVQVAHNVQVGPLSILCAQAGVSGSTELGAGVVLAGQVGVVGHLKIGEGAVVGAQSGVSRDLDAGARVSGSPAIPHAEWLRSVAAVPQLAELVKEVRALRRRVSELEKES